jgi:membrane protease subunit (stomatin/prohibitin family)
MAGMGVGMAMGVGMGGPFAAGLGAGASSGGGAAAVDDSAAKLRRLKELFDQGLITQNEYDAKKAEILSRL